MDALRHLLEYLGPHDSAARDVALIIARLIVAAILGGTIGIERELKHKPAGLRTQMFICFGAAFYTILSSHLAAMVGGDHTRIAAQIIPGIGFIGAGSILHSRGSVSGLTTAATMFVVASIGMATGAGLFFPALFATMTILIALLILGALEERLNLKASVMAYEVEGQDLEGIVRIINKAMDEEQHAMQTIQISRLDHHYKVQFKAEVSPQENEALLRLLRESPIITNIQSLGTAERE